MWALCPDSIAPRILRITGVREVRISVERITSFFWEDLPNFQNFAIRTFSRPPNFLTREKATLKKASSKRREKFTNRAAENSGPKYRPEKLHDPKKAAKTSPSTGNLAGKKQLWWGKCGP